MRTAIHATLMFLRRKRKSRASERGQAMYEMLMVIPAFLLLFAIANQIFGIAFDSQYVHVKSRTRATEDWDFKACDEGPWNGQAQVQGTSLITKENAQVAAVADSGQLEVQSKIECR